MALEPGTKLGPYEITAPIDAGGMGEIHRATGTRLRRAPESAWPSRLRLTSSIFPDA
jgi:hypothetical protein